MVGTRVVARPEARRRSLEEDTGMSYVERNLIPGEKVFYKTGLHWSVLIGHFLLGALFAIARASALDLHL